MRQRQISYIILQKLLVPFTRRFLRWLYTDGAWGYDLVAAIVSAGEWNKWVRSIIPYIQSGKMLEIAFGTGHLQQALAAQSRYVYGIDASRQMIRITRKRLTRCGAEMKILQARAQAIPFPTGYFSTIIATFPADFIFQKASLAEMRRVLDADGRLLILTGAKPYGEYGIWKFITWLFQITAESDLPPAWMLEHLNQAGFSAGCEWLVTTHAKILILEANPAKSPAT